MARIMWWALIDFNIVILLESFRQNKGKKCRAICPRSVHWTAFKWKNVTKRIERSRKPGRKEFDYWITFCNYGIPNFRQATIAASPLHVYKVNVCMHFMGLMKVFCMF